MTLPMTPVDDASISEMQQLQQLLGPTNFKTDDFEVLGVLGDGAFGHVSAALLPGCPAASRSHTESHPLSYRRSHAASLQMRVPCCLLPPLCWPAKQQWKPLT